MVTLELSIHYQPNRALTMSIDSEQLSNILVQQMSSLTPAYIGWSIVFSIWGIGYYYYGKRKQNYVTLSCGIILMVCPYFVSNTYLLALFGVVISFVPYFWRE